MAIDKEKTLEKANKYILKGQLKKAIKEYLSLIVASPEDKRLHLKLGDLYLKIGNDDRAINEYLKLGDLYVEDDLNSRAISIYKKILSIDSKRVEAFQKLAHLYLKEGLFGSARNCYQSILEIDPTDRLALEGLRKTEAQQPKEIQEKIPILKPPPSFPFPPPKKIPVTEKPEPLSIQTPIPPAPSYPTEISTPDKDAETHYHLGIAYKQMEIIDQAISEFKLASMDPSIQFDCYIMLGSCYRDKGDYPQSIDYYKKASEIKGTPLKKLALVQFHLGLSYEANGMVAEALKAFHHVLNLDPSFSQAKDKIQELQLLRK